MVLFTDTTTARKKKNRESHSQLFFRSKKMEKSEIQGKQQIYYENGKIKCSDSLVFPYDCSNRPHADRLNDASAYGIGQS